MSAGHFVYEHLPAIGLGERDPRRPFVTGGLGVTITISVGPFDIIVMSLGIAQDQDLILGIVDNLEEVLGIAQAAGMSLSIEITPGTLMSDTDDIVDFTVGINAELDAALGMLTTLDEPLGIVTEHNVLMAQTLDY